MSDHEYNARLATKVMGWTGEEEETFWPNTEFVWRDWQGMKVYDFTGFDDLTTAWRLVEAVRKRWGATISVAPTPTFLRHLEPYSATVEGGRIGYTSTWCNKAFYADSPARAICLAAEYAADNVVEEVPE